MQVKEEASGWLEVHPDAGDALLEHGAIEEPQRRGGGLPGGRTEAQGHLAGGSGDELRRGFLVARQGVGRGGLDHEAACIHKRQASVTAVARRGVERFGTLCARQPAGLARVLTVPSWARSEAR